MEKTIYLAGGCFWGTEHYLKKLRGITFTQTGFANGNTVNPTYKEVRMSPNIDTNDLNTKVNGARKFLEKGDKIKVNLRFRGREMSRMQQSMPILEDFAAQLSDVAQIDKPAKVEGRSLVMILSPKKN